jgi:hypothetical protein
MQVRGWSEVVVVMAADATASDVDQVADVVHIESDLRELASVAHHLTPLVGRTLTPAPAATVA